MSEEECADEIGSMTKSPTRSLSPAPVPEIVHTLTPFLAHVDKWLVLKGGDGVIRVIEAGVGGGERDELTSERKCCLRFHCH